MATIGATPKHGGCRGGKLTPLYRRWAGMKVRCHSESSVAYGSYGARGIRVCEEWRNSFASFESWALKSGFSQSLQLDRIDNDRGYSPDNCRWVTSERNCANRRRSVILPSGETTSQVAVRLGLSPQAIRHRLKKSGISPYIAGSLPKVPNGGMRKHFKKHHKLGKWEDSA